MRPGQNNNNNNNKQRMRGRPNGNNNNRKGPNPLTRTFESNGPDVKIRGNPQHIAEKYLQLARDAQTSGDPVMAESYLQHAEHYYRLIAAAQLAQQQAQSGYVRPQSEIDADESEEEDFTNDRFATVAERLPQPVFVPVPVQPQPPMPVQNGAPNERPQERPYNNDRNDRPQYERQPRPERSNYQERPYSQDRQDRPAQDRQAGQERPNYQDRPQQDRPYNNNRNNPDRDNRRFRERPPMMQGAPQPNGAPVPEDPSVALPAFITAPVRVPVHEAPAAEFEAAQPPLPGTASDMQAEAGGYHLRPRRRRRPRDGEVEGTESEAALPPGDVPVGE